MIRTLIGFFVMIVASGVVFASCYKSSSKSSSAGCEVSTECIMCTCRCDDGSSHEFEACHTGCEPHPVCPYECPPDVCTQCTGAPSCPDAPDDGLIGAPCTTDSDCELGATCFPEQSEMYDGQLYYSWKDGSCILYGTGDMACDPQIPATCPEGSKCIYLGTSFGVDYYGCFDACAPADTSGIPYDWACGCREGYRCSVESGVCLPGCSNDRECCQMWDDTNQNGSRDPGEVTFFADCNGWCDNIPDDECKASYSCIYPGNPSARIADPCEHDYQCVPSGMCLSSIYKDPQTGEPYYPGGYCTITSCDLVGRGCASYDGVCADFGGFQEGFKMCVRPCTTGTQPGSPGYDCRESPDDQKQACMPAWMGMFLEEPPEGKDGYCWFGNFSGGDRGIGTRCTDSSQCTSPFGLGVCADWFGGRDGFCSVFCNEKLVNENQICGGVDENGVAEGVCASIYCLEGCGDLHSPPDENDCSGVDMACNPLYILSTTTYVPEGAARPVGVCLPKCTSDRWCQSNFGPMRYCDALTGSCK